MFWNERMTSKKPQSAPPHIMVVEDDRLVLAMLVACLEHAGYVVSSAKSAEEADDILAGGLRPDLAILDIRLPGQCGLYLAQRLKDLDHIPFFILSAYSDERSTTDALQHGALAFYAKPIEEDQLLLAVKSALARGSELHELRAKEQHLQRALDNERCINVAVGITMVQYRLSREAAFQQLRTAARNRNVRLADLATEVLRALELTASDTPRQAPKS